MDISAMAEVNRICFVMCWHIKISGKGGESRLRFTFASIFLTVMLSLVLKAHAHSLLPHGSEELPHGQPDVHHAAGKL